MGRDYRDARLSLAEFIVSLLTGGAGIILLGGVPDLLGCSNLAESIE